MRWDLNQTRQQWKNLVTALFLASEIGVIKIEAHTRTDQMSTRENPVDFWAQEAATEYIDRKMVAHVDEVHSQHVASHCQTLAIL